MKKLIGTIMCSMVLTLWTAVAQKIDESRMQRDIEVAENVLKTLIRQQFDTQRMFFGLDVEGSYQEGFGVTFKLPADFTTPIGINFSGDMNEVVWMDGQAPNSFSYSFSTPEVEFEENIARKEEEKIRYYSEKAAKVEADKMRLKERTERKALSMDSIRNMYNEKVIEAAKEFFVDYGDLISQLSPNERLVVTNRGEQPRVWVNQYFTTPKRSHLSLEILKSDITAYKQGKMNRDQALAKIKVVNTESVNAVEPDLELLSSIFNRLYRSDLSTNYFTDEGIYYERLKDFGAIYYMKVYSSNQNRDIDLFNMPTAKLRDIDKTTRDKKVKEMYPLFEKELKENLIEYGRTLKSLNDSESLIFNVKLTRCDGCGIPSTLELSVKSSVLKDFSAGKISKESAIGKIALKKGPNQ